MSTFEEMKAQMMLTLENLMELSYDEVFEYVKDGWVDRDVFEAYVRKLESDAFDKGVSMVRSGMLG